MATPIPANQARFRRDDVISATGGTSGGPTWESVCGVVTDSRAIQPGNLFVALRGELRPLLFEIERPPLLWAIAGGIALTIAANALFHALSLGPANIVVPIYGMFIVGGSVLGVLVLGEAMPWHRVVGLIAAVIGVILISI